MKKKFSTELAYILGIVTLGFGVAFMEKADFGVSMVIAPAYVLYRAISLHLPFFTFGMAEYCFQGLLLLVLMLLLRRFRLSFLFSFVTAVLYGLMVDLAMAAVRGFPLDSFSTRVLGFIVGFLLSAYGVSLFFRTYIAPEVYELFVKEMSAKTGVPLPRFKTGYDIASCLLGVALSFLCFGFGKFVGVKLGTVICALLNGMTIGLFGKLHDKLFTFTDALPFRAFFENR